MNDKVVPLPPRCSDYAIVNEVEIASEPPAGFQLPEVAFFKFLCAYGNAIGLQRGFAFWPDGSASIAWWRKDEARPPIDALHLLYPLARAELERLANLAGNA